MDSFYVTLTSQPTNGFPHNTNTHFQKRIANTIELNEGPWTTGVTSLFIPDADQAQTVLDGIPDDTVLAHFKWTEVQPASPTSSRVVTRTFDLKKSQLGQAKNTTDLMHALVTGYTHSKVEQMKNVNSHFQLDNTQYPKLDHVAPKFVWKKNRDLLMDNNNTNLGTFSPRMVINKMFAIKMGWITEMVDGSQHVYDLGPNLIETVLKKADGTDRFAWDIHSEWIDKGWGSRPRDSYWGIAHNNKLYLSIAASWTFVAHTDPLQTWFPTDSDSFQFNSE